MNLAEWLKGGHPLAEQIEVMLGVARALSEAHEVGACHGDAVAPGRIEIVPGGQVRFLGGTADVIGESQYRPPELAEGGEPSPRSDVFAAGAVFYEILTGKHPYAGESLTGVLVVDFDVQPEHLRQKRPDISGDLADAIMACLEKDPDWRAKDLDYVVEMLQKAQATGSGRLRGPAASASPRAQAVSPRAQAVSPRAQAVSPRAQTISPRVRTGPPRAQPRRAAPAARPARRGRGGGRGALLGGVAVLVLVGGAGAGWYYLNDQGRGRHAAPTPPPTTMAAAASEAAVQADATPEPPAATAPAAIATPTPIPAATPLPTPTPLPIDTPPATATPLPTPPPTPAATPPPAATPTPLPLPAEPAVLSHLTPPGLQRRPNLIVDVRGTGLRPEHRPVILRGGRPAPGIEVLRTKYSGPELIQMLLTIDAGAPTGDYSLHLVDGQGTATNTIGFKVE